MKSLACAFGFAACMALPASAAVLVNSNLDGSSDSGFSSASGKAIGFTLGTAAELGADGYQLDSIVVRLKTGGTVPSSDQYTFALYSDDGVPSPGTQLMTFTSVTLTPSTTANYTLSLSGSFVLQPGTTYWIAATGSTGTVVNWQYGGAAATTTAPGISFPSPLSYFGSSSPSGWTSTSGNYTDIQINATAVPETSSFLLGFAAVSVFGLRRRA